MTVLMPACGIWRSHPSLPCAADRSSRSDRRRSSRMLRICSCLTALRCTSHRGRQGRVREARDWPCPRWRPSLSACSVAVKGTTLPSHKHIGAMLQQHVRRALRADERAALMRSTSTDIRLRSESNGNSFTRLYMLSERAWRIPSFAAEHEQGAFGRIAFNSTPVGSSCLHSLACASVSALACASTNVALLHSTRDLQQPC